MNEVTRVLSAVEQGDRHAAEQLLPLVYEELRKLAAQKLTQEAPGQTLQATALVHEAYLRLVADEQRSSSPGWQSRGHFFAAAAEAMRRILVDRARAKQRLKRGAGWRRVDLNHLAAVGNACEEDLLALDEVLGRLAQENKPCAELVKLRFFAGLTLKDAAAALGLPQRTANRYWAYARAWLYEALNPGGEPGRENLEKKSPARPTCAANHALITRARVRSALAMSLADPQIMTLFWAALEYHLPQERAAYLDQACGSDAGLRARVEALLKAHGEAGDFLGGGPSASGPAGTFDERPVCGGLGKRIGRYKLMEQIGEGGMGLVFVAEQEQPVRRRVALKLIKPGMDSRAVIARFEAERQALALMDHPNIATVLDAGTTRSGSPYFVMELVKGVPITEFCDQNRLPPRARLELFVSVCQAVQHAHQKGIIHRDVKPSNVLVTLHDGTPVVKMIDFGVAKAIGQQVTDKTVYTAFTQMVGTPLYMSPEQAEMSGLDIDTRSDIYSLGVLLYELLTGTTPFDQERLRTAGYDEIRRIIREEEPPKPSTRLSDSGAALASISAQRHMEPAKLTKLVRGELDWIVMKCLEKDRNRRYETASALAADVQRHLQDEPVVACPPSAGYRLRKFARRNKAALAASALIAVALLMSVTVLGVSYVRVAQEKDEKENALRQAEANFKVARQAVDKYFTEVSESQLLEGPGLEGLRRQLLEDALTYYDDFTKQHRNDTRLQAEVATAYLRLAEIRNSYWSYSSTQDSLPSWQKGVDLIDELVRARRDTPKVQAGLAGLYKRGPAATSTFRPSPADMRAGRYVEVVRCLERQVELWSKFVQDNPNDSRFQDDLAVLCIYLARRLPQVGRRAEALRFHQKATDIWEKLVHDNPTLPAFRRKLAAHYHAMGVTKKALALLERLSAEFPSVPSYRFELALAHRTVAVAALASGNMPEAEKGIRKAQEVFGKLFTDFPAAYANCDELACGQIWLGDVLLATGRAEQAEQLFRQALAGYEDFLRRLPRSADFGHLLTEATMRLASRLQQTGRHQEALKVVERTLKLLEKAGVEVSEEVDYSIEMARCYPMLGASLQGLGRHQEAESAYRQAIDLCLKRVSEFPAEPRYREELGHSYRHFAFFLGNTDRHQERENLFRAALQLFEKLVADGPDDPDDSERRNLFFLIDTRLHISRVLMAEKRYDEAETTCREALSMQVKLVADFPANHRYRAGLGHGYGVLASALENTNRHQEREKPLRDAQVVWAKLVSDCNLEDDRFYLGCNHESLGRLLKEAGRREDAEQAYRQALAVWTKLVAEGNWEDRRWHLACTHDNLGHLLKEAGRLGEAAEAYLQALGVWEKLVADFNKADHQNHLSWNHASLVVVGRHHQAIAFYEKLAAARPNELVFKQELTKRYVETAKQAVELAPKEGKHWNTLGVAHYRAGDWKAAIAGLERSMELRKGGDSFDWFFLAMAHRQLGNKDLAREWYDQAVSWMDKNQPTNEELRRFRTEAAELLAVKEKQD